MAKTFFKRDEKKYLLSQAEYEVVKCAVNAHMQPDKYYKSSIASLYFDTPNDDLVIESLAKPNYKYKVRARHYGEASGGMV